MPADNNKIFKNFNVAIFEPHYDFSTNPTLTTLTEKLIRLGANMDLYCPGFRDYPDLELPINLLPFPYRPRLWCYGPKRTWLNLKRYFSTGAWCAHSTLRRKKYDLVLGVDQEGIIAAWSFTRKTNVPMGYLSFELMFRSELRKASEIKEKTDEMLASQHADFIIIQDESRAKLLRTENLIDESKIVLLPVAPQNSITIKSDYLRRKFQIPLDKKIVLHSGSFKEWTYPVELVDSLSDWPRDLVLVIHTRDNPRDRNPYINRLRETRPANLILSTEPLNTKEYEEMVASADIGLVLYKPVPGSRVLQKNIEYIGLASGKFSYYVKNGLPIISFRQRSYSDLLKRYRFGINIQDFSEMTNAIEAIFNDYASYRKQALKVFKEKLDFDVSWKPLEIKLKSILL